MTRRNKLDEFRLAHITDQINQLVKIGYGIILVVSGSVACGKSAFDINPTKFCYSRNLLESNSNIRNVYAGLGQIVLIEKLTKAFEEKRIRIAQILLRKNDLGERLINNRLEEVINCYLDIGIVPVFNENDVVDLNSFGGNDFLAGGIAGLLRADKLLILSSWQGSIFGIGGGEAKKEVLKQMKRQNIEAVIIDGKRKNSLLSCFKT